MQDFQFYVTDDRYAVRSLLMVTVADEGAARRAAARIVGEPHHLAVEAWRAGVRRFLLIRPRPESAPLGEAAQGRNPPGADDILERS